MSKTPFEPQAEINRVMSEAVATLPAGSGLPTLRLGLECAMMNPPKPMSFGVFDEDGDMIGEITLDELRRAAASLEETERRHEAARLRLEQAAPA